MIISLWRRHVATQRCTESVIAVAARAFSTSSAACSWPPPIRRRRKLDSHSHRAFNHTDTTHSNLRGLFNIPELTSPEQFPLLAQQAMVQGDALRDGFEAVALPSSLDGHSHTTPITTIQQARRLLYQLDAISRVVCNVIDAAELCRNVHVDAKWRDAAHQAFVILSDYISHQLNADTRLYAATLAVRNAPDAVQQQLTPEEVRLVQSLQEEFERDGVHLTDASKRDDIRQHQTRIVALESQFHQNLVTWQRHFGASRAEVENVLPPAVLAQFGIHPRPQDPTQLDMTADAQILQTLTKYSTNAALRQQVYREYATAVPENKAVLQQLRHHRHALAQQLGYPSHGHRYLQDKMVSSPEAVDHFLNNLVQSTQAAFKADMERLAAAKGRLENGNTTLEAWDISHYTALCKAQGGSFDSSQLSAYLSLTQTIEAIQILCSRLFGLRVQPVALTADERWDGGGHPGADDDPGIRRLDFSHEETGEPLGILYLDLHPRPGKYGHAAHFTVRCGCVTNGATVEHDDEDKLEYQLPVVALVCNLSSGRGVLTHGEVETVFHELGHAMHSLLSRTQFQHLSGTRAPMDYVETPSQLFENFVWDTDFLRILCRDPVSGSTVPDEMIKALQRSRFEFTAIERRNQIIYSKFDQRLFSSPGNPGDAYDIFASLHAEYGMPFAPGTHWYSRFGHLVTYASGYYGYLFSSIFAQNIWQRHLAGNSLCSDRGRKIWNQMLIHGGARDPNAILADLKS